MPNCSGLPSEMWMRFTAPTSIITSLSDRLTTYITGIQVDQAILNVSNANTHTALQLAQGQIANLTAALASQVLVSQVAELQIVNLTTIYGAALNLAQGQIVNLTAALASQVLASQVLY